MDEKPKPPEPPREVRLTLDLHLARDVLETHFDSVRDMLQAPVLPRFVFPDRDDRLKALKEDWEKIAKSEEYKRVVDHLDEVIKALKDNKQTAAKQRATLLIKVIKPCYDKYLEHKKKCDKLIADTVADIEKGLGIPSDGDLTSPAGLRYALTNSDIPLPPRGLKDKALTDRHAELQKEWKSIFEGLYEASENADSMKKAAPELKRRWLKYQKDVKEYEAKCLDAGKKQFRENVGMPEDISNVDFDLALKQLFGPLRKPEDAVDEKARKDENVKKSYETLLKDAPKLEREIRLVLRNGFDKETNMGLVAQLYAFALRRELYEIRVGGVAKKQREPSKWLLYAGVFVTEGLEELAEAGAEAHLHAALGKEFLSLNPVIQKEVMASLERSLGAQFSAKDWARIIQEMEGLDAATRRQLMAGLKDAQRMLAARGLSPKEFNEFLKKLRMQQSGFLKDFLKNFTNPAFLFIFLYYIAESDNKLQAFISFFSFYGLSKITTTGMEKLAAPVLTKLFGQRAGLLMKNPVIQFTVCIGAILGLHETGVLKPVFEWIDKPIPEGKFKEGFKWTLGVVEEPLLWKDNAMVNIDLKRVDVKTGAIPYLLKQTSRSIGDLKIDFKNVKSSKKFLDGISIKSDTDYVKMWNDAVDVEIGRDKNPVNRRLYALNKIDDAWVRRRAVDLWSRVGFLKEYKKTMLDILAKAREDDDNVPSHESCSNGIDAMIDIATTTDLDQRNDVLLNWAMNDESLLEKGGIVVPARGSMGIKYAHKIAQIHKYVESKKESNKDLYKEWSEYLGSAQNTASLVGLYRTVKYDGKAMYNGNNKEQWLGKDGSTEPPLMVQEGMVDEIVYRARMQRAKDLPLTSSKLYGEGGLNQAGRPTGGGGVVDLGKEGAGTTALDELMLPKKPKKP